jgi:hypothetical protein
MADSNSIYSEPCKFLKTHISDIKKKIPNFIIDLHKIRNLKVLLDNQDINYHIRSIFVSILAIRLVLEKTNNSD